VREHAAEFLQRLEEDGEDVPAHVRGELLRFLDCGILGNGFVRVWCERCKDDLLVAFSCKGRGVCPSCGGRRMADTAARWVEHVLPAVPYRQWVLSLPMVLRYRLAWDPELTTEVLTGFQRAIGARLRLLARRRGLRGTRHGAVTVIQRFGGALNLNVHLHSLVADGVWWGDCEGIRFERLRVRDADVRAVVARVRRRVVALLRYRGLVGEEGPWDGEEPGALQRLAGAAVLGRSALGDRSGLPLRRLGRRSALKHVRRRKAMQASIEGFDVHAAVRVGADRRERLEQLGRYLLRPALAGDRLSRGRDGNYVYRLRRPWSDGTEAFVYSPMELMERLAALVPMPRANLVRYHGVFAPAAAWRADVVPRPPQEGGLPPEVPPDRVPWAELLRRVFRVDVLRCTGCGGRRRLVAEVTDPVAARRILEHLGLDPEVPRLEPVRGPPADDGLESWPSPDW